MTDSEAHGLDWHKRTARRLLLAYCLFIVYGCFLPFRFNFDPNFVAWRWEVFLLEPMRGNLPRVSVPDAVSNVLLFFPFGILCAWAIAANHARRGAFLPVLLTTACGVGFGIVIESGQTLSPWRSPSLIDILSNAIGAFIGAAFGRISFRPVQGWGQGRFGRLLREQPSWLALGYLMAGVLIDSFYPFAITLDISTVWRNIRWSHWLPFHGPLRYSWLEIFAGRVAFFALIGYVVSLNIRRRSLPAGVLAWLACSLFALAVETAKLFFAGRSFDSENVLFCSLGALAGILLETNFPQSAWLRSRRQTVWFLLVVIFLLHFELSPFDWISATELSARFSRIEWLPFKSYYAAEPLRALFDLQRKIYFLAPLGFTSMALYTSRGAAEPRKRALLACMGIAIGLESLQLFVRSRVPSTTDLITFSASAWAGILVFELLQRKTNGMLRLPPPRTDMEEA